MPENTSIAVSSDDDQPETVLACPDCDSTGIRSRVQNGYGAPTHDKDYYCRDCGHSFDEPVEREPYDQSGLPGLAGRLDRMDPDDVDDQLVTDGGQDMVTCCPHCQATQFFAVNGSHVGEPARHDDDYCCGRCGETFDDPDERARRSDTDTRRGLAGKLARMGEEKQPMTDGGEAVVYYATGQYDVYHECRDCRYLKQADSIREIAVSTLNGTRDPCGACVEMPDDVTTGEIVTDGGTPTAAESEYYEDGSFVTCPDCGGELQYQNRAAVLCLDCEANFGHYYSDNGRNQLLWAPGNEITASVYDPADDERDERVATDGGQSPGEPVDIGLFATWHHKAAENVQRWGLQDTETLLLAMQEEMGELTQAHLEATHEDGDHERIEAELADLGALLLQLHMRLVRDQRDEPVATDGGQPTDDALLSLASRLRSTADRIEQTIGDDVEYEGATDAEVRAALDGESA
ncbi:hypothetical protein [Haloarcula sp. JP-L23]|uniref:hypothetical protein n=1 Tax=Haloarcula sp. JP-L23 TaxID=2716717 RepID=UPI001D039945